jgi:cell division protein FtsB
MKLNTMLCATLLLASTAVLAQVQPKPQFQQIQAKPPVAAPSVPITPLEAAPSNLQLNTEEAQLKRRIAELEREKAKLEQANSLLEERVRNFTILGGSEVHAYCSADTVSRNTAGATEDCGAYSCERVSGLCRTTCSDATHCLGKNANCDQGKCTFAQPPPVGG